MSPMAEVLCDESPLGFHEPLTLHAGVVCVFCDEFWRR